MDFTILSRADLPRDGNTYEFEGAQFQDTGVSFIWVDMPPGDGVRLHQHAYPEVFIIQEGAARYTVGAVDLEASAGQIIIVPANTPHKFVNASDRPLRQIDLHLSREIVTHWLED